MKTGGDEEIGRELKVSELKVHTVVVLSKPDGKYGDLYVTMWVLSVSPDFVFFTSGVLREDLALKRTGPDWEQLTDLADQPVHVYEYLGKI